MVYTLVGNLCKVRPSKLGIRILIDRVIHNDKPIGQDILSGESLGTVTVTGTQI